MKVVAWSTAIVGTIVGLLWPSIVNGFRNGFEIYLLNDTRIYLHLVPIALAVGWAIIWGAPFARRWWWAILAAQYVSLLVVALFIVNPAHLEANAVVTMLLVALALALVVALWMGPALLADLRLRRAPAL